MVRKLCSFMVLVACGSVLAHAGETTQYHPVDEMVVTATLSETPVKEIPAAIEVITREEILGMGVETLHQILTEAQSVNLEPVSGRMSTARLRGLSSSNTLVMIDGMRLPSGFQDKVDLGEIPAGLIERVEIVRGPGSALYGSDAIGGVINVITRRPTDETEVWFNTQYGESRHGEAENTAFDAGVSGSSGSLGYVIAGSFVDKGRFDFDTEDMKTDGDDKEIVAGSAGLTWQLGDNAGLTFGVTYADVEREGLRPKRKKENEWLNKSERFTGRVEFQSALTSSSSLLFRAYRSEYDWNVSLTPTDGSKPEIHDVDQTTDQFEGRWTGLILDRHKLTAGIEYRTEDREEDGVKSEIDNLGVFLQDELTITNRFNAILGLRFDDHSGFGSVFSPRISAAYRVSDYLRLRGSYGEGFRAPSAFELYSGSPYTIRRILIPNPDLDPETSRTWEAGADIDYGILSIGLTGFRNDIDDMIAEVFTGRYEGTKPKIPVNEVRNIAEAMTQGIELSVGLDIGYGLRLADELTLQEGENKTTGEELLYVPEVSNVLKLSYSNPSVGFSGNIRLVTTGSQYTTPDLKTETYSIVNVYASKSLTDRVRLYTGVDNLFDEQATDGYGNVYGPASSGTFVYGGLSMNL